MMNSGNKSMYLVAMMKVTRMDNTLINVRNTLLSMTDGRWSSLWSKRGQNFQHVSWAISLSMLLVEPTGLTWKTSKDMTWTKTTGRQSRSTGKMKTPGSFSDRTLSHLRLMREAFLFLEGIGAELCPTVLYWILLIIH